MSGVLETSREKMLCYCLGVPYGRVIDTVRDEQCKTVQQVTRLCKAGGGCRSCHPEIEGLLAAAREERRRAGSGLLGLIGRLFRRRP